MKSRVAILSLFFLFFAPFIGLSSKIDFMQNDDWYYYDAVSRAKNGIFVLSSEIAPTLYTQIFLGVIFSQIISLPILTSLVTLFCGMVIFYLIFLISRDFVISGCLSLLYLLNPLVVYAELGFMTEAYFMIFYLLAILFFYKYIKMARTLDILAFLLMALFSFLVRQVGLTLLLSVCIYFLFVKDYKKFFAFLAFFLFIYLFYLNIFPRTLEMSEKGLQFSHLLNLSYVFNVSYGVLIYLAFFTFPVIFLVVLNNLPNATNYKKFILTIILTMGFYFLLNKFFTPDSISWGEFPYFENTFERTGLYPRSIHGTKYHFRGIYDLYYYGDLAAKITVSFLLAVCFVWHKKIKLERYHLFITFLFISYLGVALLAETFYDRYIIPLIPLVLVLFSNYSRNNFSKIAFGVFLVFLFILSYSFAVDFVENENFVWQGSTSLVNSGVSADKILSTSAWNEMHLRSENVMYLFSYDTPNVNEDLKNYYELIETFSSSNPLGLFIDPRVNLYRRKI